VGKSWEWKVTNHGLPYLAEDVGDRWRWYRTALIRVECLRVFADEGEPLEDTAVRMLGWYAHGSSEGCGTAHEPHARVQGESSRWIRVVQNGGIDT
jgi:hypothetical protein